MKKLAKSIIALVLIFVLAVSILPTDNVHAAATRDQALSWAYGKVGVYYDYDGVAGRQCVDLIYGYYAYLGVPVYYGNGCDFISNSAAVPAGWTRIPITSGFVPQAGDIAVWQANHSCGTCITGWGGHVGIITSADTVGFNAIQQTSSANCYEAWFWLSALSCVIRPNFASAHTHSYGSWTTTKSATCTATGTKTRSCACGHSQTESIPALGHLFDGTYRSTVTAPTCTQKGVAKQYCARPSCYVTKQEDIPATGHDYNGKWQATDNPLLQKMLCATCQQPVGHGEHPDAVYPQGWNYLNNSWYYLRGNTFCSGWLYDGAWYYMNKDYTMATGWVNDGGTWYYLNGGGAMQTGWLLLGNTWYYLNSSGAMVTGWLLLGNTWYYLNSSGAMHTGWLLLGNTWYYLDGSGAMVTGWQNIGGTSYYFDSSGYWVF